MVSIKPSPQRGEVYLVNFDPTVGAEIQKTRPALILQNDIGNAHGAVTIVAAITIHDGDKLYPTEVLVPRGQGGLEKDSVVLLTHIRTVDMQRLVRPLGKLSKETMTFVDKAIKISLGLND